MCLIFYNDKNRGVNLQDDLKALNYKTVLIHGSQDQAERIRIMNQIRRNKIKIIISTDLLSRGIDVKYIDFVVNFDAPANI